MQLSEERQSNDKMTQLVKEQYYALEKQFKNLRNKISDNVLQNIIIPFVAKNISSRANQLSEQNLLLLIQMILKTLDFNLGENPQINEKNSKRILSNIVDPIIIFCTENNWAKKLENTSFNAKELKKFAEHFSNKYQSNAITSNSNNNNSSSKSETKNELFEFVRELLDRIIILEVSFAEHDQNEVIETIFYKMLEDSPSLNPPSEELFLKLDLLIKVFADYSANSRQKAIANNAVEALTILQQIIYKKKASLDLLPNIEKQLKADIEERLSDLRLNELALDHPIATSINELNTAIEKNFAPEKIYPLFNSFTEKAMSSVSDVEMFKKLKAYENKVISYLTLKNYDVFNRKNTEVENQNLLRNLMTLDDRLKDSIQDTNQILIPFSNNLPDLILRCNRLREKERQSFVNNILKGLFSDNEEDYEKSIQELIQKRNFARDKRYVRGSKTIYSNDEIIESGDERKLSEENINIIKNTVFAIKTFEASKQEYISLLGQQNLSSIVQSDLAHINSSINEYINKAKSSNNAIVTEKVKPAIERLSEQKQRVLGVISRIETLGKELSLDPETKDKSQKLLQLAESLKEKTDEHYRTIKMDKQHNFKDSLVSTVHQTFDTVGNHRCEWAKRLQVVIVNALLFAISIPKRLLTNSWIVNMNTNTQNKLEEAQHDIEKIFVAKL